MPSLLVVSGSFGAGGLQTPFAAWGGTRWRDLRPSGDTSAMRPLCVYRGGVLAHDTTRQKIVVLRQDGTWSTISDRILGVVRACVTDGDRVWVMGTSLSVDGHSSPNGLFAFDGVGWAAVPGEFALSGGQPGMYTQSLAVWDHRLVVAGFFDTINGLPRNKLAVLDNDAWQSLDWPEAQVPTIGAFDGSLYAGTTQVRRWNGSTWEVPGADSIPYWGHPTGTIPTPITCTPDGVFVVGFNTGQVWKYDGIGWTGCAFWRSWRPGFVTTWRGRVVGFHQVDSFGYEFTAACAEEDGWHPLGDGPASPPTAMCTYDGRLVIGGVVGAGGMDVGGIAAFDGEAWDSLGGGVPGYRFQNALRSMVEYDGGLWVGATVSVPSGPASWRNAGLWKWDGSQWEEGPGGWTSVFRLVVHNGGLYAMGGRTGMSGARIARFNAGSWIDIASSVSFAGDTPGMTSDGTTLYVHGDYLTAVDGVAVNRVAAWNGTQWSALGVGPTVATAVSLYRGELHAGGLFHLFERWNGQQWEPGPQSTQATGSAPTVMVEYHGDLLSDRFQCVRWSPESGERPFGTDAQPMNGAPQRRSATVFQGSVYFGASLSIDAPYLTSTYLARWTDRPVCDCDSIDFNRDGLFPDITDITDFFEVFQGGECVYGLCDIDFNNDGLFPDTLDIQAFLSVFSGGECVQ